MTAHRVLTAGSIAVALLVSLPAFAAEWKPFSSATLSAAQKDGKSILVDISAPWCPTCRAQKPILEELTAKPEFKDLVVLKVDFDTQKDVVRQMRARMQSTIVAFRGDKEVGRSVGDTKSDSLQALLDQAVR